MKGACCGGVPHPHLLATLAACIASVALGWVTVGTKATKRDTNLLSSWHLGGCPERELVVRCQVVSTSLSLALAVARGSLRQVELCPVKQGDVCAQRGHLAFDWSKKS